MRLPFVLALLLSACAADPVLLPDAGPCSSACGAGTVCSGGACVAVDAGGVDAVAVGDQGVDAPPATDAGAFLDALPPTVDGEVLARIYESCALGADGGSGCGPGLECLAVPRFESGQRGICTVRCSSAAGAPQCPGRGSSREVCFLSVCVKNCAGAAGGPESQRCFADERCSVYDQDGLGAVICVP